MNPEVVPGRGCQHGAGGGRRGEAAAVLDESGHKETLSLDLSARNAGRLRPQGPRRRPAVLFQPAQEPDQHVGPDLKTE